METEYKKRTDLGCARARMLARERGVGVIYEATDNFRRIAMPTGLFRWERLVETEDGACWTEEYIAPRLEGRAI